MPRGTRAVLGHMGRGGALPFMGYIIEQGISGGAHMKEERAAYIQAIRDLDGDLPGRRAALDFVEQSDIWVHGAPARFP